MSNFYFDWNGEPLNPVWATFGNFDSVHIGHQALIAQLISRAKADHVDSLAVTFWPHPRVFFTKESKGFYLTSRKERYSLLEQTGLDNILTLEFDQALANLDAEQFLKKLNRFAPLRGLMVGKGFVLGKNRQGTEEVLREICGRMGITIEFVEPLRLEGEVVSSRRIRQALDDGDMALTARLLGRTYQLSGIVAHGNKLGSKLGFPTANIYFDPDRKLPRFGVYVTKVELEGQEYMGVTNVGIRPTFEDDRRIMIETYLLDYEGDLYGKPIKAELVEFLRDEKKFEGEGELKAEVERNIAEIRKKLHLSKKEKLN